MNPMKLCTSFLVLALLLSGCTTWNVIDHRSPLAVDGANLIGKWVRVTSSEGTEKLRVTRVLFPFLDGKPPKPRDRVAEGEKSINLRGIDLLEVRVGNPFSLGPSENAFAFVQVIGVVLVLVLFLTSGGPAI